LAGGSHASLLAHQGGWDEVLLIGGPMLIIVGLLWLAKRRVDANDGDPSHMSHGAGRHGDVPHGDRPRGDTV
jgi:hypothetical protein